MKAQGHLVQMANIHQRGNVSNGEGRGESSAGRGKGIGSVRRPREPRKHPGAAVGQDGWLVAVFKKSLASQKIPTSSSMFKSIDLCETHIHCSPRKAAAALRKTHPEKLPGESFLTDFHPISIL